MASEGFATLVVDLYKGVPVGLPITPHIAATLKESVKFMHTDARVQSRKGSISWGGRIQWNVGSYGK